MDTSLFPKKEEWGSGDEAMDNRLSVALNKTIGDLCIHSIREFYYFGLSQKPRAFNPSFHTNIEFVTKALINIFAPDDYVDHWMLKIKGDYESKEKIPFVLEGSTDILQTSKKEKVFRYKGQIDFHYHRQFSEERNPYVRSLLKRSPIDQHAKIVMKDFKAYLQGTGVNKWGDDALFSALKGGRNVLVIHQFAEIWFHEGSLFMIPAIE